MSRGFLDDDGPRKSDLVDLDVTVVHQTAKAWLVKTPTGEGWVAKSIGELDGKTLTLPKWIAQEKGQI